MRHLFLVVVELPLVLDGHVVGAFSAEKRFAKPPRQVVIDEDIAPISVGAFEPVGDACRHRATLTPMKLSNPEELPIVSDVLRSCGFRSSACP